MGDTPPVNTSLLHSFYSTNYENKKNDDDVNNNKKNTEVTVCCCFNVLVLVFVVVVVVDFSLGVIACMSGRARGRRRDRHNAEGSDFINLYV